MEHELRKPLSVYSKAQGDYTECSHVVVAYTGKKGLKAIKRMQDLIYKSITEQSSRATAEKKESKNESIDVEEIFDVLEMTGNSEKLFDEICGTLKAFATVGEHKLDDALQDQMDTEDLETLYEGVLKTFLLPRVCQKLNSMSK